LIPETSWIITHFQRKDIHILITQVLQSKFTD
jgi:hypothetical protein